MLVRGVVVGDGVDYLAGWHGGLNSVEEATELLMPMTQLLNAGVQPVSIYSGPDPRRGRAPKRPDQADRTAFKPGKCHQVVTLGAPRFWIQCGFKSPYE